VRRLRRPAIGVAGDLGDPAAAGRAVDEAVQGLGGLELLIVNHGIWPSDEVPVAAMTDAQWGGTLRANLDSVLYVCRAAIPAPSRRREDRARLVHGRTARRGVPRRLCGHERRGHLVHQVLAVELAPRRINVNCVAPGWVDTEMSATPLHGSGKGEAGDRANHPARPLGEPGGLCGPIVFLCSDLAGTSRARSST